MDYTFDDNRRRRPATVGALDARVSVWGQATRAAIQRRGEALIDGAVRYAERVGRCSEVLPSVEVDAAVVMLAADYESLVDLASNLAPAAVRSSCRLLWVDADRLRERLAESVIPPMEQARIEVRRRQALYRRRARLWQLDQWRLDELRESLEAMKVPRCSDTAGERIALGLLERHQRVAPLVDEPLRQGAPGVGLKVRAPALAGWIAELDARLLLAGSSATSA